MAAKFRTLHLKIKYSQEIFKTAIEITLNDRFFMYFLKTAFKRDHVNSFRLETRPSYLLEETYKERFNSNSRSGQAPTQFNWIQFESIQAINPQEQKRPDKGIFEQFQYDVAVNIWKQKNNVPGLQTPKEILGLQSNSDSTVYKQAKKQYLLAMHPDKDRDHPIREELTKCLNRIIEILDEEYKGK